MGPIWDRQDPGESHAGPMNFALWDIMIKLLRIKRGYDKRRPKYLPNRATSPTWLNCDVAHLPLTARVASQTPLSRIWEHEERRQARETPWTVNTGIVFRLSISLLMIVKISVLHYHHQIWMRIHYSLFGVSAMKQLFVLYTYYILIFSYKWCVVQVCFIGILRYDNLIYDIFPLFCFLDITNP